MATETAPLWKVEYSAKKTFDHDWERRVVELYAIDRSEARGLSAQMLQDDGYEHRIIRRCYQP
jgi:uncharacterized Zn finger protein